jgi:D-alanyl-D-alanine endopeptidase (penicillin-binding protein 7)
LRKNLILLHCKPFKIVRIKELQMVKPLLAALISSLVLAISAPAAQAASHRHHKAAAKKSAGKHVYPAAHGKRHRIVLSAPSVRQAHVRARAVGAAPAPGRTFGDMAGLHLTRDPLGLMSSVALVLDQSNQQVLFEKNSTVALPIASITKLMTSVVVVEAKQDMDEVLEITDDDVDHEKFTSSRLKVGARMSRANMLHIALMSSENRAASALGRNYPGGLPAFVQAMNAKARALGMNDTHYVDSNGLSSRNVASARDLAKLVVFAHQYPILRQYSTDTQYEVSTGRQMLHYASTNPLTRNSGWDIGLQKTGFINEAGRCLVMQARIEGRDVVMVFLDSKGKDSRLADAGRIRKWLEALKPQALTQTFRSYGRHT